MRAVAVGPTDRPAGWPSRLGLVLGLSSLSMNAATPCSDVASVRSLLRRFSIGRPSRGATVASSAVSLAQLG